MLTMESAVKTVNGVVAYVTQDDVQYVEPNRFAVEASDIGLRPGQWPRSLETNMGNQDQLVLNKLELDDGYIRWADYRQKAGVRDRRRPISLRVYND